MFKNHIAEELYEVLKNDLNKEEILDIIEVPANKSFGDYSFPTFTLAKIFKKSPAVIAEEIAENLDSDLFSQIDIVKGFINFHIDRTKASKIIVNTIQDDGYGMTGHLNGVKYVMDFSSPNIAKPFSMGHLRATVLGDALSRILEKNGAEVTGINHLGDWGTQFGKLIVAYEMWGDQKLVEENPIKELFTLYTKFHREAEKDPALEDAARKAFSELENGHSDYTELWQWFRTVSLDAFQVLYDQLDISFEHIQGESFYNEQLSNVSVLLEQQNLLEFDDGAYIVRLKEVPPALIKKRDGSSLYITRDIAAMIYRTEQFNPDKILYVVGQEQSVHFEQLSQLSDLLGMETDIEHIPFGLILKDGKKMSTRKGEVVLLEDIISDIKESALDIISERNPELQNKDDVASKIAVGAIKFHDLKHDRMNSYDFNIEDMLKFDGETATYIMYTNSRIQSILRRNNNTLGSELIYEDTMWPVLSHISKYEEAITEAADRNSPSIICKYVMQLCRLFNTYYGRERIIGSANESSKLLLLHHVSNNIKDAMSLLGIETVDQM